MKPLYDISSRCHLAVASEKILLQALNPDKTLGMDCEFPFNLYTIVPSRAPCGLSGRFDLTKVFKDTKMQTQKGDRLTLEVNDNKKFIVSLERSIGLLQQQQQQQQTLAANLRKRKRVRKQQVIKIERKETALGEEQRLLICQTRFTASSRLVQFKRGFEYSADERAVLYLPTVELQTACGELAVIGPAVTISISHENGIAFSTTGLTGMIEFQFHDRNKDDTNISAAVAIPSTMHDYQEMFSLQLILFCMQIFSQCKYTTLFFIRGSPLILSAETANGVRYHVYITPSLSTVVVKKSEEEVPTADSVRIEPVTAPPVGSLVDRVDLSALQSTAFRPHAKPKRKKKTKTKGDRLSKSSDVKDKNK